MWKVAVITTVTFILFCFCHYIEVYRCSVICFQCQYEKFQFLLIKSSIFIILLYSILILYYFSIFCLRSLRKRRCTCSSREGRGSPAQNEAPWSNRRWAGTKPAAPRAYLLPCNCSAPGPASSHPLNTVLCLSASLFSPCTPLLVHLWVGKLSAVKYELLITSPPNSQHDWVTEEA